MVTSRPLALLAILPSLAYGWSLGIWTVDSCGNPGGPDSSRSGVADVTADCMAFSSFDPVQALEVQDWDDGCVFNAYGGGIGSLCDPAELLDTYTKDTMWPTQGAITCINHQSLPGDFSFQYVCGG